MNFKECNKLSLNDIFYFIFKNSYNVNNKLGMKYKDIFDESMILQIQAKEIGLDWLEVNGIFNKLREEANELEEAYKNKNNEQISEEMGDLLFTIICLARHLNINPNKMLESANEKFKLRFEKVCKIMHERGKEVVDPDEMEEIWQMIKEKK